MNINKIFNKDFYIIDCRDFVYFPRKVRVIGFESCGYSDEILFKTNLKDSLFNENRKMYLKELERFKSFEEAFKEAERLNELPDNKKRADDWNNPQTIFKRRYLESLGEW